MEDQNLVSTSCVLINTTHVWKGVMKKRSHLRRPDVGIISVVEERQILDISILFSELDINHLTGSVFASSHEFFLGDRVFCLTF